MDESSFCGVAEAFQSQDAGRQNLKSDEADCGSTASAGFEARDWLGPSTLDWPSVYHVETPSKIEGRYRGERPFYWGVILVVQIRKETVMPFLIPVLVGIPVLFGGGYVIYH